MTTRELPQEEPQKPPTLDLKLGDTVHAFNRTGGECMAATITQPVNDDRRVCVNVQGAIGGRPTWLSHDPHATRRHSSGVKPAPGSAWGKQMVPDTATQSWHLPERCPHGR